MNTNHSLSEEDAQMLDCERVYLRQQLIYLRLKGMGCQQTQPSLQGHLRLERSPPPYRFFSNKLGRISNPSVVKEISHIQFPQLTKLQMRGSKIESMELIHRIHLPVLRQLWMDDNFIVSASSLSKCSCSISTLLISKTIFMQATTPLPTLSCSRGMLATLGNWTWSTSQTRGQ